MAAKQTILPINDTGADFSACRTWRYRLWRHWSDAPWVLWLLLNPSTADEIKNDPTVERCERRARMMGYGGYRVCNIFALRSTDPKGLYAAQDPIGPANDEAILADALSADQIVCGWGTHGKHLGRGRRVLELLQDHDIEPYCLRMTKAGEPGHPLYIGYKQSPVPIVKMT